MIYTAKDIEEDTKVGGKAVRLFELCELGHNVPPFVVLDSESIGSVVGDDKVMAEKVLSEIREKLQADTYAVRSAAFIEDDEKHSHAGQFLTKLHVAPEDLTQAIGDVAVHAENTLGSLDQFSMIIEEFVEPEYAGVLFTRDPRGHREMVLEYKEGRGELVVGGEVVERQIFLYENVENIQVLFAGLTLLSQIGRTLEEHYGHPQDIEWAIAGGELYILQTRPITTVTSVQAEGIRFADRYAKEHDPCFLEQTVLSETFSAPTPLSFSILASLYASGGPIEKAYRSVGVSYSAQDQIVQVGNAVFVDREAEIHTLFPSLGYLDHERATPKLTQFSGSTTTLKNWWRLHALPIKDLARWQSAIQEILTMPLQSEVNFKGRWESLLNHYEQIYLINLFAQKALDSLKLVLGKDAERMLELVSHIDHEEYACDLLTAAGLAERSVGNSVSIDDISVFTASVCMEEKGVRTSPAWWKHLPNWKRQGLSPKVLLAKKYMVLREEGRWCSVRLLNYLREGVASTGERIYPDDPGLVYFHTIEELLSGSLQIEVARERRLQYEAVRPLIMPKRIANFTPAVEEKEQGIAPGEATGVVVDVSEYDSVDGPKILRTNVLSPELATVLPHVDGVVSREGGVLSHLAIIARELGVPVVVTRELPPLGSCISINGTTGKVMLE